MGVVVLDADEADPLLLAARGGIGARQIVRVEIAGDRCRADIEQTLEMADLLLVMLQRLHIFQIADVLAGEDVVPF